MQDDQNELMLKAKRLLNAYCQEEFGSDCDFADLAKIGIGYTTISDEELEFQAYANLIDHYIELQIDGECVERVNYDSLEAFVENGLEGLSFDDLIHLAYCFVKEPEKENQDNNCEEKKDPVARLDFLGSDGSVGESVEYYTEEEFLSAVKKELYYGVPLVIVLYRDREGRTIPRTFIKDLDTMPKGFVVEPAPGVPVKEKREERGGER